jgi:hypothetical protein
MSMFLLLVWKRGSIRFKKIWLKIKIFWYILNHFDVLILKNNKNIILIYFDTVCLNQFRFFLKKFSSLTFFYKNQTDLKKTPPNFKRDSSDFLNSCYHVTSYANPVIIIACCSRRILTSYSSSASLS